MNRLTSRILRRESLTKLFERLTLSRYKDSLILDLLISNVILNYDSIFIHLFVIREWYLGFSFR